MGIDEVGHGVALRPQDFDAFDNGFAPYLFVVLVCFHKDSNLLWQRYEEFWRKVDKIGIKFVYLWRGKAEEDHALTRRKRWLDFYD